MENARAPKTFKVTLIDTNDGSGDCLLPLNDAILKILDCRIGDQVEVEAQLDGTIAISKTIESGSKHYEEVEAVAIKTFGNPEMARDWLNRENISLGMSPVAYLNKGNDKSEILKILHSIAHGGVV